MSADFLEDPIAQFEAQQLAAAQVKRSYNRATRELFNTVKGRRWLTLAMAKFNFMGSVFTSEDGMNPTPAAHRDGARAFISEILNASFDGKTKPTADHDDE